MQYQKHLISLHRETEIRQQQIIIINNKKQKNMTNSNSPLKTRRILVLEVDKKNRNHRIVTEPIVDSWMKMPELQEGGAGIPIEDCIADGEYDYEFLKDEMNVGKVTKLEKEGKKLYATCVFKNEGELDIIKKINEDDTYLDTLTITPKGKGAIRNQVYQDDYEIYGFTLMLAKESAFVDVEPENAAVEA